MSYTNDLAFIINKIQYYTQHFVPVDKSITSLIMEYQKSNHHFVALDHLPPNPNPLDVLAILKEQGWLDT